MRARLPFATLLLLTLAAPARGEAADLRTPRETCYGIRMGTARIGHAQRSSGPLVRDGRSLLRMHYRGDSEPLFGWHAWAEVVIDGRWVPVDPMWGEVPVDATHIREGPKGSAGTLALAGARLEVLHVDRKPPPKEIPDPWDD